MPISYHDALELVSSVAQSSALQPNASSEWSVDTELVPLAQAMNRTLADAVCSHIDSPALDTSAMDGFAVSSNATALASEENPITFAVLGMVAAGDAPLNMTEFVRDETAINGCLTCVEIMTGAPFPFPYPNEGCSASLILDACVPIEHTSPVVFKGNKQRYIQVSRPLRSKQHRRLAGEDFHRGDVLAESGSNVTAQLQMAMAAVGIQHLRVLRRMRIGIWSTGAEVMKTNLERGNSSCESCVNGTSLSLQRGKIHDANSPYITSALQGMNVETEFLGVLSDDPEVLESAISKAVQEGSYDALISTGAVSAGVFDFVREAIEAVGARVVFHKVAIRPGHPVLFATFSAESFCMQSNSKDALSVRNVLSKGNTKRTAFFGLPGNPVAAAACLRFLVMPYIRQLKGQPFEHGRLAKVVARSLQKHSTVASAQTDGSEEEVHVVLTTPVDLDVFRHGIWRYDDDGVLEVELSNTQSPSMISAFSQSNCWIHIPAGVTDVKIGQHLRCYPLVHQLEP